MKPDPDLEREKVASRTEKIDAIRERVSGLTDALIRSYGARTALLGGASRPPILGF